MCTGHDFVYRTRFCVLYTKSCPSTDSVYRTHSIYFSLMLEAARLAARAGSNVIILQLASFKLTPDQSKLQSSLKVWCKLAMRITSRNAIWQQKGAWTKDKTKACTWKGLNVWMAGPPTMGQHARLQRVTQHKIIIRDTILTEVFNNAHQG